MTDPVAPAAPALPAWADDLGSTILMGFLEGQVATKTITQDDLQTLVNGARSVAAIGAKIMMANPQKVDLWPLILATVKKTPPAQQSIWDAGIHAAVAAGLAKVDTLAHAAIHSRLGIFAGPADALLDRGLNSGAEAAEEMAKV